MASRPQSKPPAPLSSSSSSSSSTSSSSSSSSPKSIVFFHPDLGIGGAERLIIDAAVGLQGLGHRVTIFTSHRDRQHCFDEARDGTLDVRVRGDGLVPPSLLARFTILCAVARQLHLLLSISLFSRELERLRPDVFFVDQLSAGLPLLRCLCPSTPILFYCHFPDLLLAKGRQKWWKRAYRAPFDRLEEWSMGFADAVCVNSGFTKGVVSRQWPGLVRRKELEVVYPCVDVRGKTVHDEVGDESLVWKDSDILLSINRFEKKKDVGLAIRAYAGLGRHGRKGVRLVVAGGYDNRVQENVTYHKELTQLADSLGLKSTTTKNVVTALGVPDDIDVLFLLSVPNSLKDALLKSARLLVYTPSNEHFGIVPLEAMLAGTPVLAANTGGPLETVVDGVTGWLCSPDDVEAWTVVMDKVLHKMSNAQLQKMSEAGTKRVMNEFSDVKMAERLENIVNKISGAHTQSSAGFHLLLVMLSTISLAVALATVSLWKLHGC